MIPNSRDIYDYRYMYKKFLEDAEEDYNEKMDDIRRYDNLLYKIKFELEKQKRRYSINVWHLSLRLLAMEY